jgi:hypothetical protein
MTGHQTCEKIKKEQMSRVALFQSMFRQPRLPILEYQQLTRTDVILIELFQIRGASLTPTRGGRADYIDVLDNEHPDQSRQVIASHVVSASAVGCR